MALMLSIVAGVAIIGASPEPYFQKRIELLRQVRTALGEDVRVCLVIKKKKRSEMEPFIMPVKHEQEWCQRCQCSKMWWRERGSSACSVGRLMCHVSLEVNEHGKAVL